MDPARVIRGAQNLARTGRSLERVLTDLYELLRGSFDFDDFGCAAHDPFTAVPIRVLYRTRLSPEVVARNWLIEMTDARHAHIAEIAARPQLRVATLSAETGGRLEASRRYREILSPFELEHEARIVFRTGSMFWGSVSLRRDSGRPKFDPDELELLGELSSPFAEAIRRTFIPSRSLKTASDAVNVVVLSSEGRIVSCTKRVERLLSDLTDDGLRTVDGIPTSFLSVAVLAREPVSEAKPLVRVLSRDGSLWTIRGSAIAGSDQVALVVEPSRPAESAWMILAGYGLTDRQCSVALYMARGLSTHELSEALGISEYTVQDHFKAIFDKTGLSSRKELAARLFLSSNETI